MVVKQMESYVRGTFFVMLILSPLHLPLPSHTLKNDLPKFSKE
jgi:hypothetical protein